VTAWAIPELLPQTDLIRDDEWLRKQNATLCCATGTCTLNTGTKTRTLSLADDELPQTDDQALHLLLATMLAAHLPPAIITMKQAKKAIRKGATHFSVIVQPDDSTATGNTMMCSPKAVRKAAVNNAACATAGTTPGSSATATTSATNVTSAEIQQLLNKYKDVFADLPPGLPPVRNIAHTIPLIPDAKPPAKRVYRLSPAELTEVQ
jgi:hypothetical protein